MILSAFINCKGEKIFALLLSRELPRLRAPSKSILSPENSTEPLLPFEDDRIAVNDWLFTGSLRSSQPVNT